MIRKFTNLELSKLSTPVKLSQNTHSDFFYLDRKFSDVTCKVPCNQKCLYSECLLLEKEMEFR